MMQGVKFKSCGIDCQTAKKLRQRPADIPVKCANAACTYSVGNCHHQLRARDIRQLECHRGPSYWLAFQHACRAEGCVYAAVRRRTGTG